MKSCQQRWSSRFLVFSWGCGQASVLPPLLNSPSCWDKGFSTSVQNFIPSVHPKKSETILLRMLYFVPNKFAIFHFCLFWFHLIVDGGTNAESLVSISTLSCTYSMPLQKACELTEDFFLQRNAMVSVLAGFVHQPDTS